LKGAMETLTREVAEINAEIKTEQDGIAAGETIRETQHKEHVDNVAVNVQAIAALQEAVTLLRQAQTGKAAQPSLLQASKARDLVRTAIRVLPGSHSLSEKQLSLLATFADPFVSPDAHYASQLDTVIGILAEMYSTFSGDLETLWTTEGARQRSHEELVANKQQSILTSQERASSKEQQKATAGQELASIESMYQEQTEFITAATDEFDHAKASCLQKSQEWNARNSLYTDEKEALSEAIDILSSDEARTTFGEAIKPGFETRSRAVSFLQTSEPSKRAVEMLRTTARSVHSLRLASIGVMIQETSSGHFDAVMKAIDDMIQVLIEEQAEDLAKRDDCVATFHTIALSTEKENHTSISHAMKRESIEGHIQETTEHVKELEAQISAVAAQVTTITATAEERKTQFDKAQRDDLAAIELLQQAIDALSYWHNRTASSLVQAPRAGPDFGQPTNAKEFDTQHTKTFSDGMSHSGEAGNVITLLRMVQSDLHKEHAQDAAAEAEAVAQDAQQVALLQKQQERLERQKADAETAISELDEALLHTNETITVAEGEIARLSAERASMEADCSFVTTNYAARQAKRTTEKNGLTQAKAYLAGYQPQPALAQVQHGERKKTRQQLHGFKFLGLAQ